MKKWTEIRWAHGDDVAIGLFSYGIECTMQLKYSYGSDCHIITLLSKSRDNYVYLNGLYLSINDPDIIQSRNNLYFTEYIQILEESNAYFHNPITEHILSQIFKLDKPLDYALKTVLYNYANNTDNDYYLDIMHEKNIVVEYIKKCIKNYKLDILPENYIFTENSKLNLINRIIQCFNKQDKLYLIVKMKILVRELENLIMNI